MMATTNGEHERVVEEIVREILDLDTSGSASEGGYGSEYEAVVVTWKEYLTPEQMAEEFRQAVGIIEGFSVAAENIGPVLGALLGDCKKRAEVGTELAQSALEAADEQGER
jgi:hypothetical protein